MGFMRVAAGTIAALVVGAGLGMPPHSAAAASDQAAESSDGLVAAPSRPKGILKGVQRAPGSQSGAQGSGPQSAPYYAPSADQQPDGSSGTGHAAGWGATSNSADASSDSSSAASPSSPGSSGSSGSSGSGGSYSAGSTPSSASAGSGSDPASGSSSSSSGRQDRDRGGAYPPPGGPSSLGGPSPHTLGAPPRHEPPRGWGLNGSGQPARQAARAAQGAPGAHAGAPRRPEFDKPKVGERWRALREQRQGARQTGARPQGRPLQSIKRAPPKPQASKAPGGASTPKAASPQAAPSPSGPPEKKGKPGGKGR